MWFSFLKLLNYYSWEDVFPMSLSYLKSRRLQKLIFSLENTITRQCFWGLTSEFIVIPTETTALTWSSHKTETSTEFYLPPPTPVVKWTEDTGTTEGRPTFVFPHPLRPPPVLHILSKHFGPLCVLTTFNKITTTILSSYSLNYQVPQRSNKFKIKLKRFSNLDKEWI